MRDLLTLIQWLSPAFPTGAFAYSHGLEAAMAQGQISNADTLFEWLSDILIYGAGWQDAVILAQALAPDADYALLADYATALQSSAGRRNETLNQGTALARTVSQITGQTIAPAPLPVVLGQAAATFAVSNQQIIALYLHSFASNLTSVGVRFVPLGQTEGQQVLDKLHPIIADIALKAAMSDLEDLGGAAIGADMAAMAQETLDVRLFKS